MAWTSLFVRYLDEIFKDSSTWSLGLQDSSTVAEDTIQSNGEGVPISTSVTRKCLCVLPQVDAVKDRLTVASLDHPRVLF